MSNISVPDPLRISRRSVVRGAVLVGTAATAATVALLTGAPGARASARKPECALDLIGPEARPW